MGLLNVEESELRSIAPASLETLFSDLGWVRHGGVPGLSNQWIYSDGQHEYSAVVPLEPSFDDYPGQVWASIERLALTYPHSLESLMVDLVIPGLDEITSRKDAPTLRGSIQWKAAEDQIIGFRQTLTAAAKATEARERHFGVTHRKMGQDFLNQLRMGQTRVGSFVVTALSPIGVIPTVDQGQTYDNHLGATGRTVLETLAVSLNTLLNASDDYLTTGFVELFDEAIPSGVSLDLINGVRKNLGDATASETTISWSPRIDSPQSAGDSKIIFESRHAPALKVASKRLRELDAQKHVNIVGMVTALERAKPGEPGEIVVDVIDGSEANTVRVTLDNEYNEAVDYHKSGYLVRIIGVQERENTKYRITSVSELRLIDSRGETDPRLSSD